MAFWAGRSDRDGRSQSIRFLEFPRKILPVSPRYGCWRAGCDPGVRPIAIRADGLRQVGAGGKVYSQNMQSLSHADPPAMGLAKQTETEVLPAVAPEGVAI
jgi:hypothetical protein